MCAPQPLPMPESADEICVDVVSEAAPDSVATENMSKYFNFPLASNAFHFPNKNEKLISIFLKTFLTCPSRM